ncbi:MAG: hypothetical protein COZ31_01570 [Nitrospirae bacterium CG_4_10_14_3_um_filter_44_29]|nr:hypothetical protein [Nitrospirota bacterium]OIO29871.1 MAG: hypothetical protein AUJ60_04005 [Nitrospirae bacterium CG1_02_44_142]PIP70315.1 MAG: hypothetical protein COW90_05915 [Nitrospirae bacterium CG22_combo_CG10-13_8_21_14_all_44_11]PIV40025.1 MAG: hypothetical protein COS28_10995 [Nitrospirae bacterium CG02_land_8_20_14_3_00_44_33]PIV66104.1 MAG: hypothetical protein COS10_07930 [Nitrospirae bacterium CG01_land_8_20_14_3_00_44_22]PIW88965.1 MAG: hypothetical protein COZ93_07560 [Nit
MLKTLKLLQDSPAVKSFEIIDFKSGKNFYYLKIKAEISNSTTLFIREYLSQNEHNYSFHWQRETCDLLMRWDNSPHHERVKTFPHHRHLSDGLVLESYEISVEKVLDFISKTVGT